MKYRDSGMPEEAYWEILFDAPLVLDRLGIDGKLANVTELGCGFGTFTIPVAQRISGVLHTVDIDPAMVQRTQQRLNELGITNVQSSLRDVTLDGFGVEPGTQDGCLLFNILHGEDPIRLLTEARRILKVGGRAFVIHWRYDPTTPRGPAMDIRPKPEQCLEWAQVAGFQLASEGFIELPPYHWGMVLRV
jgi:SAM-dependent methyltransferase